MFIKCGRCGKGHPILLPFIPDFAPEEIERRRKAWLEADAKLSKSPNNEHFEKAYFKAWFAYGATMSNGVSRIPDTISTAKKKGGAYIF